MHRVTRTDEEIDELRNAVMEQVDSGGSRFSGMSYDQGIDAAIAWLLGDSDDHPYPDA